MADTRKQGYSNSDTMMGCKKKIIAAPHKTWHDKVGGRIAGFAIMTQTKFTVFMNKIVRGIPTCRLKVLLLLFCLFGGGSSIYLIANAVFHKDNKPAIHIEPVQVPTYYDQTGAESSNVLPYMDKQDYEQATAFRRYMDSLHNDKNGKYIYDSIMFSRPGLMDSVKLLEEIYQSQFNK
ncbi:hypothetical protein [Terrimonas alba]|uniref:hypothetical protein n=1 Tax=Terrimonas alba TaxID=3349636 RepID=UPI0035F4252E